LNRWLAKRGPTTVKPGSFDRYELADMTQEGLAQCVAFHKELCLRVLKAYSGDLDPDLTFARYGLSPQAMYGELFAGGSGAPSVRLVSFAAECLAHWSEETFECPLACGDPKPHSGEPAFDLISLHVSDGQELRLHCIQAKATQRHPVRQGAIAVRKFGKLDDGRHYLPDLANNLNLLRERVPHHLRSQLPELLVVCSPKLVPFIMTVPPAPSARFDRPGSSCIPRA